MSHPSEDTLLQYRFGTLAPESVGDVAEHLRTCADCTKAYARLGASVGRLDAYDVESHADEATLAEALGRAKAAFELEQRRRERQPAQPVAPLPAAVVSAERPAPLLPGFWAWLGLVPGGSARPLRLATLVVLLLGPAWLGGTWYQRASRLAPLETVISGESSLQAGGHGLVSVEVRRGQAGVADVPVSLALVTNAARFALAEGRTDPSGKAALSIGLPSTPDLAPRLEVTTRVGDETDVASVPLSLQRAYKVHLGTDKPMYQPGQTIHLRSLVMRSPRTEPASDQRVLFEVRDAKNARLASKSVPVSAYGIASYDLELSDDVALGTWKLTASVEGVTADAEVEVGRYTLPRYKLAVVPAKGTYLAGERLKARVTARYFFGKPVAGARVRGLLLKGDGSVLADLGGKTDVEGTLTLETELPASLASPGKPEALTLQLEAQDVAGQQERTERPLIVSRELVMVDVIPQGGAATGLDNTFFVVTSRPDGRPVPAEVVVQPMSGPPRAPAPAPKAQPRVPPSVMRVAPRTIGIVAGDLKKDVIAALINSRLSQLSACADQASRRGDAVVGKVVVRFVVTSSGRVETTSASQSTLLDGPLERCVLAQTRVWRFPPTPSGINLLVPFVFRTSEEGSERAPSPWFPGDEPTAVGPPITVRTAENGLGHFELRPEGPVFLQVRVEDAEGRKARRDITLEARLAPLVRTDKAFYRPGETVVVEVQSWSDVGAEVLEARSEGRLVARAPLTTKLGEKGEARGAASLVIPAGFVGTLDLRASRTGGSCRVVVAEPSALSVRMSTDKPTYKPGEPATLRFTVTDAKGQPAVAALGLSVVDESLFALTTNTPDAVRAFFLAERALLEPRFGLDARELLTSASWTGDQQLAGRLLLAMSPPGPELASAPETFVQSTAPEKWAARRAEDERWETTSRWVGLVVGVLALLVMVVSLSVRLAPVAGAVVLAAAILGAAWWGVPWLLPAVVSCVIVVGSLWALRRRDGALRSALVVLPVIALTVSLWVPVRAESPDIARVESEDQRVVPQPRSVKHPLVPLTKAVSSPSMLVGKRFDPSEASRGAEARSASTSPAVADLAGASEPPRREVRVRQYFPETLYVHPQLISDEKGVAEVTVPLADSITAWRVSALASSARGALGSMNAPLKVFQDFFVDLDVPVALVRGDEATVPIAVYNYLDTPQEVRLEVEKASWFELVGEAPAKVKLGAGAVEGRSLRLRVLEPGEHRLTVRADGASESDVVARELLVTEAGREDVVSVSGRLAPGVATKVALAVPEAATGATEVLVKLYPSLAATALDGIEGTLGQPTGCFEQTSATTYPNALVEAFLRREGRLTPALEQRLSQLLSLGYQRLVTFEVEGGGFEWFGRAPANQVLTAYGLMEFSDMKRVFPVEPELIERTQRFLLSRQESDGSWAVDAQMIRDGLFRSEHRGQLTVTAYVTWALTESGLTSGAVSRAQQFLVENLDAIDDAYTLALVTAGFAQARHPETGRAAALLAERAKRVDGLVVFRPTGATAYYGRGAAAEVETTALAAYALVKAGREPALTKGALEFLLARRHAHGAWASTQATTLALKALLAGTEAKGVPTVSVAINAASAGTFSLADGTPKVLVLGDRARKGLNVIELSADVEAPFLATATFTLPWRQAGEDDGKPLALTVDYGARSVTVGDVVPVDVQLTYRGTEASGMALIELGVPAGLTPLMEDLASLKNGRIAKVQVAGRKLRLYIDRLGPGERLELPLRFKATTSVATRGASSHAYLFYDPAVRVTAPPVAVAVR